MAADCVVRAWLSTTIGKLELAGRTIKWAAPVTFRDTTSENLQTTCGAESRNGIQHRTLQTVSVQQSGSGHHAAPSIIQLSGHSAV